MLVEHFGIEVGKLVEQYLIFFFDIVGVARNHKEQQGVALDVAQETESETFALARSLYNSRDVCHDERLVVMIAHDAERRFEGGEGIVGNLGPGTRHGGEQRALAGIGEPDETDVGKELKLHYDRHLLHGLSRLGIARSLVGGGTELIVAESAAASLEEHHFLSVVHDVADELSCLGVVYHSTARHVYIHVLAVGAMAFVSTAVAAVFRLDVALVFQMEQGPVVMVSTQDDASSLTAVAAVGTAVGLILHVAEVHRSLAALTGAAVYLHVVYEI